MAFLVVPASAVFLSVYGAQALPYTYLCVAVAGVVVSTLMTRAQRRWSLSRVTVLVLSTYTVLVTVAWIILTVADATWVTVPLIVMFPLAIPIGFVLVGTQAGRLLDVREMKAHFPRVAAGFPVGFAVGGLVAARLVGPLGGPEPLLGFASQTVPAHQPPGRARVRLPGALRCRHAAVPPFGTPLLSRGRLKPS